MAPPPLIGGRPTFLQKVMIARYPNKSRIRWTHSFWFGAVALALVGCSKTDQPTPSNAAGSAETPKSQAELTALDKYVAAPDTNYSFHLVSKTPGKDQTTFVLEM